MKALGWAWKIKGTWKVLPALRKGGQAKVRRRQAVQAEDVFSAWTVSISSGCSRDRMGANQERGGQSGEQRPRCTETGQASANWGLRAKGSTEGFEAVER